MVTIKTRAERGLDAGLAQIDTKTRTKMQSDHAKTPAETEAEGKEESGGSRSVFQEVA